MRPRPLPPGGRGITACVQPMGVIYNGVMVRQRKGEPGGLSAYVEDVKRHPLLTHERTIELFREMRDTDDPARRREVFDLLVRSNLRLVVSIARQYDGKGVSFLDLIQEGNVGLMEGIRRFDPERGFRLATYVSHWIKQAVCRQLTGGLDLAGARQVRLPAHVVASLPRIREARLTLIDEAGTEPTHAQIAGELNVSEAAVTAALGASGPTTSASMLHADLGDEGRGSARAARIERAIADFAGEDAWGASDPEDEVFRAQLRDAVRGAFGALSAREEQVLRLRFAAIDDPDDPQWRPTGDELAGLEARSAAGEGDAVADDGSPAALDEEVSRADA